ncbi:MAG: hypothetical protein A2939_03295 [Parcubacteria group bacterium RIFCSPLOWO2_01_FULL_48_18]|nr:MAG: hypothetical protein A2939_03295 [Parcubacteria group bacterium RIFCSPLOWO2_01_FULL_48_18]
MATTESSPGAGDPKNEQEGLEELKPVAKAGAEQDFEEMERLMGTFRELPEQEVQAVQADAAKGVERVREAGGDELQVDRAEDSGKREVGRVGVAAREAQATADKVSKESAGPETFSDEQGTWRKVGADEVLQPGVEVRMDVAGAGEGPFVKVVEGEAAGIVGKAALEDEKPEGALEVPDIDWKAELPSEPAKTERRDVVPKGEGAGAFETSESGEKPVDLSVGIGPLEPARTIAEQEAGARKTFIEEEMQRAEELIAMQNVTDEEKQRKREEHRRVTERWADERLKTLRRSREEAYRGARGGGVEKKKVDTSPVDKVSRPREEGSEDRQERKLPPELQGESRLWAYRIFSENHNAKEVPPDFQLTPSIEAAAYNVFARRELLLGAYIREYDASRKLKKSGGEKGGAEHGEAVVWRENAGRAHEEALEELKKELFKDFLKRKKEAYPKLTDKELAEEALGYSARFILETAKDVDEDLMRERLKMARESRDISFLRSAWEHYIRMSRGKRVLISSALSAGIAGGLALLGPLGLAAAGVAAGVRGLRALGAGAAAGSLNALADRIFIRKKYGKERSAAREGAQTKTLEDLKSAVKNDAEDWIKSEKRILEIMKLVDKNAVDYRKKLDEVAKREGKTRMKVALAIGVGTGLAVTAASVDWDAVLHGRGVEEAAGAGAAAEEVQESTQEAVGAGAVTPEGTQDTVGAVTAAAEKAQEMSGIETAGENDSIWRMAERQFEERFGDDFTSLDEARKTYLIDAVKDKVAANPSGFGLEDVDKVVPGQKVDFSSIFEDKSWTERIFDKAGALREAQLENIRLNNRLFDQWVESHGRGLMTEDHEAIARWVSEHAGEKLTLERIDEALGVTQAGSAVDAVTTLTPEVVGEGVTAYPPGTVPSEVVATVPLETQAVPGVEIPSDVAAQAAQEVAARFELASVKGIGFDVNEYNAIKGLKVGKLLETIPSEKQAWQLFEAGRIRLPHAGWYGASEFGKQIRLAEFIRTFEPGTSIKEMTVSQFLRSVHAGSMGQ